MLSYLRWWREVKEVGEEDDGGDFQAVGQTRVLMSQSVHTRPRKRTKRMVRVGNTRGEGSSMGEVDG